MVRVDTYYSHYAIEPRLATLHFGQEWVSDRSGHTNVEKKAIVRRKTQRLENSGTSTKAIVGIDFPVFCVILTLPVMSGCASSSGVILTVVEGNSLSKGPLGEYVRHYL
jgi:hypothetical protein